MRPLTVIALAACAALRPQEAEANEVKASGGVPRRTKDLPLSGPLPERGDTPMKRRILFVGLVATAWLSLGQIFELHGERYFRGLEKETLERFLAGGKPGVLATGGGLVTDPETYALLRATCTTIWLSARAEDHYARVLAQGDRRPMAEHPQARAELRALLASRRALYELANLRIDTSKKNIPDTVAAIVANLQRPRRAGPAHRDTNL